MYTFKILVRYLAKLYVEVPQAETVGCIIQHQTDIEFKSKVGVALYEIADHFDREDIMHLLKVVLNNCVFSFQGKFYKKLHGDAISSPCLPVCGKHTYGVF